jgi:hypothetical protein
MLRDLLPEIERGISEVGAARLPRILHEKQTAWEENLLNLQAAGAEYREAAGAADDRKLLDAAEKLHSRYAAMARLIRPAIEEIEDFHASLYMLYHYYLPDYDIEKIRSASAELKQKMAALNGAALPENFRSLEAEFSAAREALAKTVDNLESVLPAGDQEAVTAAVEELHDRYVELSHLFEG